MVAEDSNPPLQVFATLVYATPQSTNQETQGPRLDVQEKNPHRGKSEDSDVIEGVWKSRNSVPQSVEIPLLLDGPITGFSGLNSLRIFRLLVDQTTPRNINQGRPTDVLEWSTHQESAIEDAETRQSICIPKWAELFLTVCCPIACFWGLNLAGVANAKLESVTTRMYIMKLVAFLLETSVHHVSGLKLMGVGRRTKDAVFSAIFGLVAAVLTTISQIDSRADGECIWENVNQSRDSHLQNCRILETVLMSTDSAVNRFSWCCGMVRDGHYFTRSAIFSSAASASAAGIWGWLAAVLTGNATIVFAGSGCLAAASVFLLVWGSLGDKDRA